MRRGDAGMVYSFYDFTIDDKRCELRHRGELLHLERRVFDLLLYLLMNRERVVSKAEIFRVLWEGRHVSEASLSVAVSAARKALREGNQRARVIETQHARGYRFVAPVTVESARHHRPAAGPAGPFVGRAHELDTLLTCFDAAEQGERRVCLISGEPGIGKTRLADEFASRLRERGAWVLRGRCLEEDGDLPYWPWVQILRQCLDLTDGQPSWPHSVITEISRLVPEVVPTAHAPEASAGDPSRARFRLFDAVAYAFRATARKHPVALIIDDIHRADTASLLLLEFVAQQVDGCRIMFVLADRDLETRQSEFHSRCVGTLCRNTNATVILLRGLQAADVELLVADADFSKVESSSVGALCELTGGNPFFIRQLIATLPSSDGVRASSVSVLLPHSVRDAISQQLSGLGVDATRVLSLASILGREFRESTLTAMGRDKDTAEAAIRAALEARLISRNVVQPWMLRFAHSLVRDVLYERLPVRERAEGHWLAALALGRASPEPGGSTIAEIAFHMYRGVSAGDAMEAIAACERAGRDASARLAFEDAALQYSRAIELSESSATIDDASRCDLFTALGIEQIRSGDRNGGRANLQVAASLARSTNDGSRFARVALASFPGFFAVEAGAPDEAVIELLREALVRVDFSEPATRALLLGRLAMALAWSEGGRERERHCEEATSIAAGICAPALTIQTLLARWFAQWEPAQFEERWSIADSLMEQARLHGDDETLLLCRLFWVTCLLERSEMGEFRRQVTVFEEAAAKLAQPEARWYAALLRAVLALHEGRLAEAEALSRRFAEIGALVNDANVYHSRMSHRFLIAWEQARFDDLLEIATSGAERYPGVVGWRAARAWGLAMAGNRSESRRALSRLAEHQFKDIPRRMDWTLTVAFLSEVAVALHAKNEAEILYQLLLPLRGRMIVVGLCMLTWGCASRPLGKLAMLLGRETEAEQLFHESIAAEGNADALAWQARSRVELARALLCRPESGEQRTAASRQLELAKRRASELGLVALDAEISVEAARC